MSATMPLLLTLLFQVPPTGPEAQPPRPKSPIFEALDLDHDGVLSAAELAKAATSLRTLDANGDGKLSPDEYRPPRPDAKAAPAAPREDGAPKKEDRPKRPRPLLDTALDADGDEVISAAEITRAPERLKALDRNGDGRLTAEELHSQRPATSSQPASQTRTS